MTAFNPMLKNDAAARHQFRRLLFAFEVTGAKTAVAITPIPDVTFGFDAPGSATAALGQTTIDNLLGSTNEVLAATAFGSTALGTDAFGFVINMNGQIRSVKGASIVSNVGTAGASVTAACLGQTTALPNTLPALARVQKTSGGNLAGQFVLAGLDAATAGIVLVEIFVELQ